MSTATHTLDIINTNQVRAALTNMSAGTFTNVQINNMISDLVEAGNLGGGDFAIIAWVEAFDTAYCANLDAFDRIIALDKLTTALGETA